MIFKVGEVLTPGEMAKRMAVTKKTWQNDRKNYLEHLSHYFVIEETGQGVNRRYIIKKQLREDYEPYMNPVDRKKKQDTYKRRILAEIRKHKMNLQLYCTMAERVSVSKDTKDTRYYYVNSGMKEMFGTKPGESGTEGCVQHRVWARKVEGLKYDFEKMSDEDVNAWKNILRKNRNEEEAEYRSMYEKKELTKEEAKKLVLAAGDRSYLKAKREFIKKYNYEPVCVKEYQVAPQA